MKKLIVLFLAAALLLCGCSAPAEAQQSEDKKGTSQAGLTAGEASQEATAEDENKNEEPMLLELGTGTREDSLAILKFTLDPEFELYIDVNACISRVRCLNEDAVTIFESMTSKDITVTDVSYFEVITTVLEQAAESGFLSEQTEKISIDITIRFDFTEDELQALASSFAAPVEEHCKNKGFGLTVEFSASLEDTGSSSISLTEPTGEPNSQRSLSWTDDGISATGTSYYDENGLRCKYTIEYSDGSAFYEEYSNGTDVVYNKSTDADGGTLEQYYNEDGIMIRQLQTKPDGFLLEKTFHSNGFRKSSVENYADGTHYEEHYDENNSLISSETRRYSGKGEVIYIEYADNEKSYLVENGVLVHYARNGAKVTDPDELAKLASDLGLN